MKNRLIYNTEEKSHFNSFWKRVLINTLWIVLLTLAIIMFFFIKHGESSLIVTLPFLCLVILYLIYYEHKVDYVLLSYLELNKVTSQVTLKANIKDDLYLDEKYNLNDIEISVEKVFAGIGGNPKYKLNIYLNGEKLISQRGNLVWKDEELRDIGTEINFFLKE